MMNTHPAVPYARGSMSRLVLRLTLFSVLMVLALAWLEGPNFGARTSSDQSLLRVHAATQQH